ncbi:MAG: ATP-binding cassette domain-containing protein [Candidatus Cohnella colombiensis]|uniref:ATP-binding cassette domain-containing protein n=1 Tax=Candidatus Cohnella colombiensis TaxID=3121368 RepID=A0AA95EXE7_9BACL|nr:MAG: ATP-binding cassette domain-containing protein [Cohnella sp.]
MVIRVLRQLFQYMRAYKPLAFLFFFTLMLDLVFISLAPLSFKFIIDRAVIPQDMNAFLLIMSILGITGVVCISAGVVSDYALAKLTAFIQRDLRAHLFEHMQHVNIGHFQKTRASELLSYFTVDLPAIERAMSVVLTVGIQSTCVVIISTSVLFYLQWSMSLAILLGAVIIFVGPYLLGNRAQAINAQHKQQLDLLTGDLQENIKAQKVIKGFNLQQAMIHKFTTRLQEMLTVHYRKNVIGAQLERTPMVSLLLVNLTIIGFGSFLAMKGHITTGALVAFFTMYTSMGNSVFNLTFTLPALTDASVSIERIENLLHAPRESNGGSTLEPFQGKSPSITFNDVTFGYNDSSSVLNQIKLYIPAGATAAFVGSSGSGKSTMVQLILGFYEPQLGQIQVNDHSLFDLNRGSYRDQIGIVFQDNFLFHGTVLDNIRLSYPEASEAEVESAARKAEIHEYIASLPDGYYTKVLDEGSNFSGGQRQRIAITRAILRNPPILVLDEATSALDPISEASINRTFESLAHDRTVVTVTHRLSSIKHADCIFVFDQGKLVEQGTHEEMLQRGGFYQNLWDKQSGLSVSVTGQEADIDEQRLSRLPFFRGVEASVLSEIKSLFNTETFRAGQVVIQAGEQGEKFYLIARGRVEVSKRDTAHSNEHTRLAVLEDGDHFGEIALLENIPRTADVTAMTDCIFLTLQRKVLHYVLSKYPEIDAHVRQTLKERMN